MSSPIGSVTAARPGLSNCIASTYPVTARIEERSPLEAILLVSPDVVRPHEVTVDRHVQDLVSNIVADGHVRHPIVAAAEEQSYVLLDGTHRLAALRSIGVLRVPVQVFAQADVTFDGWAKIIVHPDGCGPVLETPLLWNRGDDPSAAVRIRTWDGERWHSRQIATAPEARVHMIEMVLSSVRDAVEMRSAIPSQANPDAANSFVLTFQPWSLTDVVELTRRGLRLPSGLTRVIVSGRILNLRIPLDMLRDRDVDSTAWSGFIGAARGRARFYDEPTIQID